MRALIVDDHPLVRRGLADLLGEALELETISMAGSAFEALVAARRDLPDLVLMDMHIPDSLPARELCEQLRGVLPQATIVLVTAFGIAAEVRDCLQAGASACLLKDTAEDQLVASLRSLASGQVVIDPRVAVSLATELANSGQHSRAVKLTSRERDVLECLAEGRSNREIAERLFITEATVKGYVSSLLDKLNAPSRLKAVVRAGELGLL